MVFWLKGLVAGFAAGTLTMGLVSFVSSRADPGDGKSQQPAETTGTGAGLPKSEHPTPTIARVQALAAEENAPIPAPPLLDPLPSRETTQAPLLRPDRGEELAAINAAQAALAAKNPRAALAELDQYERRHPTASFGQRAQLLRIEALATSGYPQAAKDLAAAFVAAHPDNPHAQNLRAFVSSDVSPP